jgi:tetratricopeptide (TPR) repeat protein
MNAQAWYYRGMTQYELGKYEEALCSFDRTIILDPGNAWAYYYRGESFKKRQCDDAIAYQLKETT